MDNLLDLENLTEEERAVILNVLKRDDRLRKAEDKKITELKAEIQAIRMKSVLRNGDNLSKMCARCHGEFGIFKRGDVCSKCHFRVCNMCKETLLNGKWLCSLCFKQRQLKWLQGDWDTKGKLQRWPSGADLVKASLKMSFTVASGTESDPGDHGIEVKRNGSTVSNGSAHKEETDLERVVCPKESDKRKLSQLFDSFKMQPKPKDSDIRQMSVKRVSSRRYSDTESSSSSEDDLSSSLPPSVMTNSVRSSPAPSTGMGDQDIVVGLHSSDSVLNKPYSDNVNGNRKSLQRKHSYDSDQTIHSDDAPFSKSSTETQIRVEVHSDNSSTKSAETCRPKTSPNKSPSLQTTNRLIQSTDGASGGVVMRKDSSSSQRSMSPDMMSQPKVTSRQTAHQPGRSPSPYSFDSIPSSHANSPLPKQRLIDLATDFSKHSSDTDSLSRYSGNGNSGTECHVREGSSGADEFSVEELTKVRFHKLSKKSEKRSRSPHSPSRSPLPQLAAMDGEQSGGGRVGVGEKGILVVTPCTPSDTVCDIMVMEVDSDPDLVDIELITPQHSEQHHSAFTDLYLEQEEEVQSYSSSDVGPESPPVLPHAPPRSKKHKSTEAQDDLIAPPRKSRQRSEEPILAPPRKNKLRADVETNVAEEEEQSYSSSDVGPESPPVLPHAPPRSKKHKSTEAQDDLIAPPRKGRQRSGEPVLAPPRKNKLRADVEVEANVAAQDDLVAPPRKGKQRSGELVLAPPRKNKLKAAEEANVAKSRQKEVSEQDFLVAPVRHKKLQSSKHQSILTPPPRKSKNKKQTTVEEPASDIKAPPRRDRKSSSESSGQESLSPEIPHQRRLIPYLAPEDLENFESPKPPLRKHRGNKQLSVVQSSLYRSKSDSARHDKVKDELVAQEENLSISDAKKLFEQKGREQLFGEHKSSGRSEDSTEGMDVILADSSILKPWRFSSNDQNYRTDSDGSFKISPMTPLSPSKTNPNAGNYKFTFLNDSVFECSDTDITKQAFQKTSQTPQTIPRPKEQAEDVEFEELFNKAIIDLQTSEIELERKDIVGTASTHSESSHSDDDMVIELLSEEKETLHENSSQNLYSLAQEGRSSGADYHFCTDDIQQEKQEEINSNKFLHRKLEDKQLWHFKEESIADEHKAVFGEDNKFSHSRENVRTAMRALSSEDSSSDMLSIIHEDTEPSDNSTNSVTLQTDTGDDDAESVVQIKLSECEKDTSAVAFSIGISNHNDDQNSPQSETELMLQKTDLDSGARTEIDDGVAYRETNKIECKEVDAAVSAGAEVKVNTDVIVDSTNIKNADVNVEGNGAKILPEQSLEVSTETLIDREENEIAETVATEASSETFKDTFTDSEVTTVVDKPSEDTATKGFDESREQRHLEPEIPVKGKISSKKLVKQWLDSELNTSDLSSQKSFDVTQVVSQEVDRDALSNPSSNPALIPSTDGQPKAASACPQSSQLPDLRIPIHTVPDMDTEKDVPVKLSPRASSEGSASLEDSGHVSGTSTQDNTPEHRRTDSTQSHSSVPSTLSTVTDEDQVPSVGDKDDESEADIDELVATHRASHSFGSSHGNLLTTIADSKESIASFYSNAGGVDYGKIPVTGDIQFGIDYNYRTGTLEICIRQCKDLAPADTRRNKSDPYVKTYLLPDKTRGGKRKTKVKKNTLSPVFDETLRYLISKSEVENRTLWVTVWHNDRFGRNDFLGEVTINFDYFRFGDSAPKWYPLQERVETQTTSLLTYRGDLILSLKYVPAHEVQDAPTSPSKKKGRRIKTDASKGQLHVLIKEARNLTAVRSNGFSDPFLKGYLLPDKHRGMKQKTPVCKKNCNPKWNYTFVFEDVTLDDLKERGLELTIWDYDKISSNDFLGGIRLNSGTGHSFGKIVDWMDAKGEEISMWQAMLDRPSSWIDGTLILRPNMDKRKY